MINREITFDRFIRWILAALAIVAAVLLIDRLSSVLLPFAIAWILAYMLYPYVHFLQYRCRLRSRVLCIVLAMLTVLGVVAAGVCFIVPPLIDEALRLIDFITVYCQDTFSSTLLLHNAEAMLSRYANSNSLLQLVQHSGFTDAVEIVVQQLWSLVVGTVDVALGLVQGLMVLLYMFFLLFDYEKISNGWRQYIPQGKRPLAEMIVQDVKTGMNAYFRGQALIAFLVGVLFSLGFLIIDFPMAIGLGMFIGVLNLVPYLQLIGFVPTILLAFIKATETGQSFWLIMLCALAVFAVVQVIQDVVLTPRIMGKVMGLNPAVILLSLSVWGSLLGMIGLIIALPLTTLLISYYKRYVLKEVA